MGNGTNEPEPQGPSLSPWKSAFKSRKKPCETPRKSPLASLAFWKTSVHQVVAVNDPANLSCPTAQSPPAPVTEPAPIEWSAPSVAATPLSHIAPAAIAATAGTPVDSPGSRSRLKSFLTRVRRSATKAPPPSMAQSASADLLALLAEGTDPSTPTVSSHDPAVEPVPAEPVAVGVPRIPLHVPAVQLSAPTSHRNRASDITPELDTPLKSALSQPGRSLCVSPEFTSRRTVRFAGDREADVTDEYSASESDLSSIAPPAVEGVLANLGFLLVRKLQPTVPGETSMETAVYSKKQRYSEAQALAQQPVRKTHAPRAAPGDRGRSDGRPPLSGRSYVHEGLPTSPATPAVNLFHRMTPHVPGPAAGTRAVLDQDKKYRMSEVAAGPAVPALTVRRYLPISSDESGTDEAEGERYSGIARVGTGPILSALNGSGLDWGAKPKVIVRRAGANGMVGRVVPAPKTARQLAAEARHAARLSTAQQTRTAEPRPLPPVRIAPAAGQSLPAPARSHAVNLGPLTPTIAARKRMLTKACTLRNGRFITAPTAASIAHSRSCYVPVPDPAIIVPAWRAAPSMPANRAAHAATRPQVDWRAQRSELAAGRQARVAAPLMNEVARRQGAESRHIDRMAAAAAQHRRSRIEAVYSSAEVAPQPQPRKAATPRRLVVPARAAEPSQPISAPSPEQQPVFTVVIPHEAVIQVPDPEPATSVYSPTVHERVLEFLPPISVASVEDVSLVPTPHSPVKRMAARPPLVRVSSVDPLPLPVPGLPLHRHFRVLEPPSMISPNRFSPQSSISIARQQGGPYPTATYNQQDPPPFPSVLDRTSLNNERPFASGWTSPVATSKRHFPSKASYPQAIPYCRPPPVVGYQEPDTVSFQVLGGSAAVGVADREVNHADLESKPSYISHGQPALGPGIQFPKSASSLYTTGSVGYISAESVANSLVRPPTPPGSSAFLSLRSRFSGAPSSDIDPLSRSRLNHNNSSISVSSSGTASDSSKSFIYIGRFDHFANHA